MTAAEINARLDRLDKQDGEITDAFIAAGRGSERPSDYLRKDDPLSKSARDNSDARSELRAEIHARYGPSAPRRLPNGFKKRC